MWKDSNVFYVIRLSHMAENSKYMHHRPINLMIPIGNEDKSFFLRRAGQYLHMILIILSFLLYSLV